jgi:hypothetical protein
VTYRRNRHYDHQAGAASLRFGTLYTTTVLAAKLFDIKGSTGAPLDSVS